MKFRRKKRTYFKRKWNYIISSLVFMVISSIISYGKIENLNWKNVFNNFNISDASLPESPDFDLNVHFLNVGKADCIYVKFKDHNILIDAADTEPSPNVVEYLKRQGVSILDLVVVSHPHRDHIGQMSEVIKEFKINKFIEPDVPEECIPVGVTYQRMLKALKAKNIDAELIRGRKNLKLDNLNIDIFGPISLDKKNVNNNSIVLKLTYLNVSFLFTGDAEKQEEAEIIDAGCNLKSDVIKIGHHGSRTSTSQNFLDCVRPTYAVISVGPDRSNLPKEEVLKRIKDMGADIYRTDLNGNIIFSSNGKEIKISTEKK